MGSDSEAEKSAQKEREKKKLLALAPIAKPLAGKKLCKRTLKLVRRAAEHKCLKRGVKEVVKSIRRGNKGICVIAGNISPIDVITHVPILCEEANIPYIYVPSKEVGEHDEGYPDECVGFPGQRATRAARFFLIDGKTGLANAGATKRPTCCVLVLTKPTKGELGQEEQEKLKVEHDQVASDISELANLMF
ncbi:UNVERIFIED_CONTAM: H/ACA ribonucleoprotein complex subunit-like protein [Sesamum angustifolium]|uniref:H/ACA ribonucleoprotein complex subunit 2 n=1 Tax=Sesamum angustifolium TaxID=2727405 RepID=A0AAW2PS12_9LAMI